VTYFTVEENYSGGEVDSGEVPLDLTLLQNISEKVLLVAVGAIATWAFERRTLSMPFHFSPLVAEVNFPRQRVA
jgi:hypothetical protein